MKQEDFLKRKEEELFEDLYRAYWRARRGKRRTEDEHRFEMNAVENLMLLKDDIINRTYKPSRGIAFPIERPVLREIFAAPFRDRVVHHYLYNKVYYWWDRHLIYDSYSCREKKGTLFGIRRLHRHMMKVSKEGKRKAYVIKLDIQGYFMSLPRRKLYERAVWGLDRQFPNKGWVYETCKYLWREIIFDDPCKGVKLRGNINLWRKMPKKKSLFCQPPGKGIVIGNLSSQLLSNIYLDQLDRFVTERLGYKHYGRYVDDFFIVVTEEELEKALDDVKVIENYLLGLGLTLHPDKRYVQEVNKGVEFLGARVYPGRILPGRRVMRFFWEAAKKKQNDPNYVESITSYMGHLRHFKSRRAIKRVFRGMGWDYVE